MNWDNKILISKEHAHWIAGFIKGIKEGSEIREPEGWFRGALERLEKEYEKLISEPEKDK